MSCPKENIINTTCVLYCLVMKAYFYITDFYGVSEVALTALEEI